RNLYYRTLSQYRSCLLLVCLNIRHTLTILYHFQHRNRRDVRILVQFPFHRATKDVARLFDNEPRVILFRNVDGDFLVGYELTVHAPMARCTSRNDDSLRINCLHLSERVNATQQQFSLHHAVLAFGWLLMLRKVFVAMVPTLSIVGPHESWFMLRPNQTSPLLFRLQHGGSDFGFSI